MVRCAPDNIGREGNLPQTSLPLTGWSVLPSPNGLVRQEAPHGQASNQVQGVKLGESLTGRSGENKMAENPRDELDTPQIRPKNTQFLTKSSPILTKLGGDLMILTLVNIYPQEQTILPWDS